MGSASIFLNTDQIGLIPCLGLATEVVAQPWVTSPPEKGAKYLGSQWSLRPSSSSRRSCSSTPFTSRPNSRLSAFVAAGSISSRRTATRSPRGCCRSSNRRQRSIATLPRAKSASRSRASFSAPTLKPRFAVWLTPYFAALGGLQEVVAQSTSTIVGAAVLTVAQVVFAELVPKSLALQYPTQTSLYTLIPMVASQWVYRPFINWLNGSGLLILRLLGAPHQAHRHIHSPDEIELLIAESRDGGLLEPDEHQ